MLLHVIFWGDELDHGQVTCSLAGQLCTQPASDKHLHLVRAASQQRPGVRTQLPDLHGAGQWHELSPGSARKSSAFVVCLWAPMDMKTPELCIDGNEQMWNIEQGLVGHDDPCQQRLL